MRPNEYEISDDFIRRLIDQRKNFFLGGRGIGCRLIPPDKKNGLWIVYFDRARLIFYCNMIKVENGKLIFTVDGGISGHGEVDLAHYLKVTVAR